MESKRLFLIGSALLMLSLVASVLVFGFAPSSIFTNPADASLLVRAVDTLPTLVFFAGVGTLVFAHLKQGGEQAEDL